MRRSVLNERTGFVGGISSLVDVRRGAADDRIRAAAMETSATNMRNGVIDVSNALAMRTDAANERISAVGLRTGAADKSIGIANERYTVTDTMLLAWEVKSPIREPAMPM